MRDTVGDIANQRARTRVLDSTPRPYVGLTEAQLDGRACIRCGCEEGAMVPAGRLVHEPYGQVFECAHICDGLLPVGVEEIRG